MIHVVEEIDDAGLEAIFRTHDPQALERFPCRYHGFRGLCIMRRASVAWRRRVRHIPVATRRVRIRPVRYPGLALGACALLAAWHFISARPLEWRPGTLVADDPRQVNLEGAEPFDFRKAHLTPRAEFSVEVRVLSRERYWLGELASLAPLDIAVGWGPMSDSAVLSRIDISQSGRFYFWHYDNEPPIPRASIESHSANWHLVPASNAVWHTLRDLRVGSVVRLEGKLVDIETADHYSVKTSLRRDDTGAGACEVIYVESASVRYH